MDSALLLLLFRNKIAAVWMNSGVIKSKSYDQPLQTSMVFRLIGLMRKGCLALVHWILVSLRKQKVWGTILPHCRKPVGLHGRLKAAAVGQCNEWFKWE